MKVGFIGLNHVGSQLIDSFLQAQAFLPNEVIVYDRNLEKADSITSKYPGILAARQSRELIQEVACFSLCIDKADYPTIKKEIQNEIKSSHVLLSLVPSVPLDELEVDFPCKVAKIRLNTNPFKIQSFSSGSRMTEAEKHMLQLLFSTINLEQKSATLFL